MQQGNAMKRRFCIKVLSILVAADLMVGSLQSPPLSVYAAEPTENNFLGPNNNDEGEPGDGETPGGSGSGGQEGTEGHGESGSGSGSGEGGSGSDEGGSGSGESGSGSGSGSGEGGSGSGEGGGSGEEGDPAEEGEGEGEPAEGEDELPEEELTDEEKALLAKEGEEEKELPENFYTVYPTGLLEEGDIEVQSVHDGEPAYRRYLGSGSLESSYISPRLPRLRDQSPYGTCWAFSTVALAEINLMKTGKMSNPDLSELHTAYFVYNTELDPLGGTAGDYVHLGPGRSTLDRGGSVDAGLTTFSRWIGVADEETVDYEDDAAAAAGDGLSSDLAHADAAHIKNYYIEPISKDKDVIASEKHDNIKRLIKQCGAAAFSFYAYNSMSSATKADVYDYETNSYYNSKSSRTNHAIVAVGWDDDYPASKFPSTPPGDGAFLIRNSWMVGTGDDDHDYDYSGYFWMSYYEATLGANAFGAEFNKANDYANNYQYDGGVTTTNFVLSGKAANIFTAHAEGGTFGETLKAAAFYTLSSNVDYKIEVYTNLQDETDPTSGTLHEGATTTGTTSFAGYYTVDLNESVDLRAGETFAIVVTLTKEGEKPGIAIEINYTDLGTCDASEGQSYFYDYGRWRDMVKYYGQHYNIKIKAFTDNYTGVHVDDVVIESDDLTEDGLVLFSGDTSQLSATIYPDNATYQEVEWSSADEEIATVSEDGLVTAVSRGTTTITLTADNGGLTKEIPVKVRDSLEELGYTTDMDVIEDLVFADAGSEYFFTCQPVPETYEPDAAPEWSVSDDGRLQILGTEDDGNKVIVKAIKPGNSTLTETLDGQSIDIDITILPDKSSYGAQMQDDGYVEIWWKPIPDATEYSIKRGNLYTTIDTIDEIGAPRYSFHDNYYLTRLTERSVNYYLTYKIGGQSYSTIIRADLPKRHRITYELNGGQVNVDNPLCYVEGTTHELLDPDPADDDYEFAGWYTSSYFADSNKKESILATDNTNLTLYARWVKCYQVNGISITDKNGAEPPSEIETGKSVTLKAEVETVPDNELFKGYLWNNYGTEEAPVYAYISPSDAATVSWDGDGDLVLTARKPGTATVKAYSVKDETYVAVKTFEIKEILPKSILFERTADTDIAGSDQYGIFVECTEHEEGQHPDSEQNLKSSLTLKTNLYNTSNPTGTLDDPDENHLSADQNVVFTVSDPSVVTIVDQGMSDVPGSDYQQGFVTIKPSEGITRPDDFEGTYYLTTRVLATSTVNKAVHAEYDVIVAFEEPEKEIVLPELQIISTDKTPKIWASSKSATEVDENGLELKTGASVNVKARFVPDVQDKTVLWASANPAVANITSAGRITAKAAGDVVITATSQSGNLMSAMRISVYDPVTSLAIDKKAVKLGVGQTSSISVTSLLPTTASDKVIFESSKPAVAEVDEKGNIRGISAGSAVITVKTAHGEKSVKCNVTVGNSVEHIVISSKGNVTELPAGKTLQYSAVFNGGVKKNQPASKEIVWKTTDESIASINAKGVLTAKKEGYVLVWAYSPTDMIDGDYVVCDYSMRLYVYSPLKKAALNKTAITMFGDEAGNNSFTIKPVITPAVATANDAGTVTGQIVGKENAATFTDVATEIVWKCKNKADQQYIVFPYGTTETDGVKEYVGSSFTVKVNAEGLAKQKAVPVTATFTPYGAKKATVLTCNVTVLPEGAGALTKLALSKAKLSINRGMDETLSATLTPMIPADSGITWEIESGSEYVRFLEDDGEGNLVETTSVVTSDNDATGTNSVRIRALVPDENITTRTKAVIKATTRGVNAKGANLVAKTTIEIGNEAKQIVIKSGKLDVTWKDDTSADPDANKGKLIQLPAGKTTSLKAAVYNSYDPAAPKAAVKAGNQKVIWRSSDTSVATVSTSGVVKAVGNGAVYIYADSADTVAGAGDSSFAPKMSARTMVYVYNAASKFSLDKNKASLGTEIAGDTYTSSLRQYDVITPVMAPDQAYENVELVDESVSAADKTSVSEKHKITWKFSAGAAGEEIIAVAPIDTATVNAVRDGYGKQNAIGIKDGEFVAASTATVFTTLEGESLAIKALRPGKVKITATAPGGKTAICTVTVNTHIADTYLKLGKVKTLPADELWAYSDPITKNLKINREIVTVTVLELNEDDSEDCDYVARLDLKSVKSTTLSPVFDIYGGEGAENIVFSDQKASAVQKAATNRYNSMKKLVVNTTFNYRSSNPAVAAVSARGVVTAKSAGEAVITVSTQDGSLERTVHIYVGTTVN